MLFFAEVLTFIFEALYDIYDYIRYKITGKKVRHWHHEIYILGIIVIVLALTITLFNLLG
jgi:ABC-type polysaccharide/polyol phosphate export permease